MNGGHFFQLYLMVFEESTSIQGAIRIHLCDIFTKHRWNDQRGITRNDYFKRFIFRCRQANSFSIGIKDTQGDRFVPNEACPKGAKGSSVD